ncbi:unnamed protein product [Aureobasidium vineae]|uniref:Alpha-L-rhamnosidase six-hairpin glycosidase domain-containing protein n=1 Tax=Aureobasidium vineae TaxID=2773715 RepID=A0A9N8JZ57_9PEZI|nr:unnamed protein product [Aureobasidium vineae]
MFAASVTAEGLTQSRYPSHVPQIIASFPLYWILQVSDHYLYFGDRTYTRSFLPRIDGVLEFFETHIDELGLVGNLPSDVWQYVDWVTTWGATDEHPDKGVPTSGRKSNRHTFFSLIYAWVLQKAASLVQAVGRPGHAQEYEQRANAVIQAVRKHCQDGQFVTDSTADIADELAYSQHCQVFGVLTGTIEPLKQATVLRRAFAQDSGFSKCSYVMQFYALRAFAMAGDGVYEEMWSQVWNPWRRMLRNNLTTWEEDDVRQRSDCHAWGSVPIYEFCTEVAGVQPIGAGCSKLLFAPRLTLSKSIKANVALGNDNLAIVSWHTNEDGSIQVDLRLDRAIEVQSQIANEDVIEHGVLNHLVLQYRPTR